MLLKKVSISCSITSINDPKHKVSRGGVTCVSCRRSTSNKLKMLSTPLQLCLFDMIVATWDCQPPRSVLQVSGPATDHVGALAKDICDECGTIALWSAMNLGVGDGIAK